ncbi:tRNA (adenosine(37)-N6)-threonylcarbamoyltransferase complex dimerization subunit type 1 TsaB [Devosia pacifica]|uniref:tRNA (Adenosine(37)-N6)-threonylcarbamoyltransferase complex dimerization subunit type 1 TsaB n=1 Tax=Devosia pacifica TaxID=1335967 RepID=A0A918S2L8_9HYPH|nr:tRNA (adenosine(37)-N6)-threonylcarbamoyltransferase complex dimerization subunit type 1 TsaB [Devosia pacifica]GHA20853.1 tRNA (adenosine(37)-N6)-threonylcarbamoyltransferase complex dimerization subunit type 1 TsaB [Devosia pacifica]
MLLAIDTAGPRLQLALRRADAQPDTIVDELGTGHAERIFPGIEALLARNNASYAMLDRLAVTTGPGSFTGLRIGLSAARGIGLARRIPVIGVPSLLAISLSAELAAPLAVCVDARRGEAYLQLFEDRGVPLQHPVLSPADAVTSHVPAGMKVLETPFCDIAAVAEWAATQVPRDYPPEPVYVRSADAKPQDGKRIARR